MDMHVDCDWNQTEGIVINGTRYTRAFFAAFQGLVKGDFRIEMPINEDTDVVLVTDKDSKTADARLESTGPPPLRVVS